MDWDIEIRESPPLIWIRVTGKFSVQKCEAAFGEIAEAKGSNPFYAILIDDREADLSELSPAELIELSEIFRHSQSIFAYGKTAILMNPGTDHQLAKRFKMMTEDNFVSFSIFTSEKKAFEWIGRNN